ncbi:MAG: AAA family ATPase [Conexivisphaera sp.]
MRIKRVEADNVFTFEDFELNLNGPVTVIVGPNGSGKTNLIRLLEYVAEVMWGSAASFEAHRDPGEDIRVTLHLELSEEELKALKDLLRMGIIGSPATPRAESGINPQRARERLSEIAKALFASGKFPGNLEREVRLDVRWDRLTRTYEIAFMLNWGEECYHTPNDYLIPSRNYRGATAPYSTIELSWLMLKHLEKRGEVDFPAPCELLRMYRQDVAGIQLPAFSARELRMYLGAVKLDESSRRSISNALEEIREFVLSRTSEDITAWERASPYYYLLQLIYASSLVVLRSPRAPPSDSVELLSDLEAPSNQARPPLMVIEGGNVTHLLFELKNGREGHKRYEEIVGKYRDLTGAEPFVWLERHREEREVRILEGVPLEHLTQDYQSAGWNTLAIGNAGVPVLRKESIPIVKNVIRLGAYKDGRVFPASAMSGGELELLSVLAAALGHRDRVVLLDEPAQSLHSIMQARVARVLEDVSNEGGNQLVIVTHSPFIVSPFKLENVVRFSRAPDCQTRDGQTRDCPTTPVSLSEKLKEGAEKHLVRDRFLLQALFADCAVLAEGRGEEYIINWLIDRGKLNFGGREVLVYSVEGQGNFAYYANALRKLGIPYVAHCDKKAKGDCEKLCEEKSERYVSFDAEDLIDALCELDGDALKEAYGNGPDESEDICGRDLDKKTKESVKNPTVIGKFLDLLEEEKLQELIEKLRLKEVERMCGPSSAGRP